MIKGGLRDIKLYAKIERVLTKNSHMLIIHRITIQRYIRYNISFVLFLLFPWQGDIFQRNYVVTKS